MISENYQAFDIVYTNYIGGSTNTQAFQMKKSVSIWIKEDLQLHGIAESSVFMQRNRF